MLLTEYDEQKFLEQEREVWKEEGREEGQARVNRLIQHLLRTSRGSEIERAVTDQEYQEKLLGEFGL